MKQKINATIVVKLIAGYAIFTGIIAAVFIFFVFIPSKNSKTTPPDSKTPTSSPTSYSCPKEQYVDCMPPLNDKPYCTKEYLQWAKKNCPNFKAAY